MPRPELSEDALDLWDRSPSVTGSGYNPGMPGLLEEFWSDVLSETPDQVTRRLAALDDQERSAVLLHLQRMAGESGWSEGQRRRAAFALEAWAGRRPQPGPPSGDSGG